jgi:regulator of protease activity HflC (stomatin/prohibitin superfamily)
VQASNQRSEPVFLEILQAVTGIFVVVYDGQHALKYTLGRAREVVGPGVNFKWPIFQRFRVVDTKDTTIDLEPQIIQLCDDLVYEVGAKAVYQIVDIRKALIEIDNLVTGLKNRLVLIVQRVVRAQTRQTVRDMTSMIGAVTEELQAVEEQWGVKFHEFGFSTFSPSPETLEITQLRKLAEEKLELFKRLHGEVGLSEEAAVALISGAVITVRGQEPMTLAKEPKQAVLPATPPGVEGFSGVDGNLSSAGQGQPEMKP